MPTSPLHPRVVGVVAAVRGQVEGDREALLPGGEVAAVEGVGLLGGGEAGVLADRPRLGGVHRRVGPAQVRRQPGVGVQRVEALEVLGSVDRQDPDALGRLPRLALGPPRWAVTSPASGRPAKLSGTLLNLLEPLAGQRRLQLLPRAVQEGERVDADRAGVVGLDAVAPGLAGQDRPTAPRPRGGPRPVARPTRRTPCRGRRGRPPAGRRSARGPPRRRRAVPSLTTSMPPAANRLVAKVARAVCGGDRAHRGQEDLAGGGLVAQLLERLAVGPHRRRRPRRTARARAASRAGAGTRSDP